MYGTKCERCGGVENVHVVGLLRLIPVAFCLKCRRAFDVAIRATHEWSECTKTGGAFDDIQKRAETADVNDTTLWACYTAAREGYEDAVKAARQWSLAWIEAECNPQKEPPKSTEGAEPDEAQL